MTLTRAELIQAGVDALPPLAVWRDLMMEDVVEYVLDAVEEKIRADEREFLAPEVPMARDDLRNELRAKVEALPPLQMRRPDDMYAAYVQRADVLALFDGEVTG